MSISISAKNGYTYEKVMKAKAYLEEIGSNKRNFPFDKLVGYYNELYGTKESTSGCKCQASKYYMGISNYFKYGKLTLINTGGMSESDFELKEEEPKPLENIENRVQGLVEPVEEPKEEEEEEINDKPKKVGRPKKNVED